MSFAREVGLRFLSAWQLLTLVPVRFPTVPYEEACVFFPLVGGLIGFLAGLLLWALVALSLSPGLAAALVMGIWLAVGGFYAEDGLARVAGSIRPGLAPHRVLELMNENRFSTYAFVVLVAAILVRWQAVADTATAHPWFLVGATTATGVLSRAAMLFLAASSKPVGSDAASSIVGDLPGWLLLVTGLQASLASSLLGWKGTAPLLFGSALLVIVFRRWFAVRLGGVNLNCLYACAISVECLVLVVAAWQHSF
jgi:cobalamin synthase